MTDHYGEPKCAIGTDVGGTKCAAGLVAFPEGRIVARRVQPTEPDRGGEAVLDDVVALVRSLQQEAAAAKLQPAAVGLGVAELVGIDGEILSEATIKWKNVHIADTIQKETGLPVTVEADVRAAARAEGCLGAGREYSSFIYVTIGTGISASLVLNGVPYAGARGLTGTFASSRGLMPANDGSLAAGPPLESFAAGPALASQFAPLRRDFTGDARDVIALADSGDSQARSIVDSAAQAAGAAIANLINMLDPEAVIIGGGLGSTEGLYRASLTTAMRAYIWSDIHRDLPIRSAALGNDAGFIGSALAAVEQLV
jgi:glucokinase